MAWHILHGLLEQVRVHSTFPGKLWIVMMFIFRIVVVARIGDNVYQDEQSSFVCNTLTPGCQNVCFNMFSPISQLRFWSLMVLVVSSPGILFCLYASHKIYHAYVKFPLSEDDKAKTWDTNSSEQDSAPTYTNPPSYKRKRTESYGIPGAAGSQLYVIKRLNSNKDERYDKPKERKVKDKNHENAKGRSFRSRINNDEDKDLLDKRKISTTDNNGMSMEDIPLRRWPYVSDRTSRQGYPVYADRHGRKVEYIKVPKMSDEIRANKESRRMLENPQLYRAYWWHVAIRTLLEAGFLVGQYFLYGFFVPELFECTRWPCAKTVDCFVSRPMEKTCLLCLMFCLGAISCLLSLGEFWTLGWERFKFALCCRGHKMTYEEKRRKLAELAKEHKQQHDHVTAYQKPHRDEILTIPSIGKFKSHLSLDSLSSNTSVESV